MNIRLQRRARRNGLAGGTDYATAEQFESLFESKWEALLRLALLLTASSEKAEQTLSLALRDCKLAGSVSADWIVPWARRAIVRSAIQLVFPSVSASATQTPNGDCYDGNSLAIPASTALGVDVPSIVKLPDFERLVFVITVLEHISIQDCALLVARSRKEVWDAQKHAMRLSTFAEHGLHASVEDGPTEGDMRGKLFEN